MIKKGRVNDLKKKRVSSGSRDKKIRLNKFISNTGICSRREADRFIEAGVITVNGVGITKMGYRVCPTDIVKFNGSKLNAHPLKYIVLNKPKNYSTNPVKNKKTLTITQLVKGIYKQGLSPVDKLKKMETGLLILTNDIELARKLSNKKQRIKSIYQITLNKKLSQNDLNLIRNGVLINNKKKTIDTISYINGRNKNEIGIENSIGGIKQINQIFEKLSYSITKLDRVFIGGITKKDLPRKKYRNLSKEEVNILKRL